MALIDDEPPITLPRAHSIARSSMCGSGLGEIHPVVQAAREDAAPAERNVDPRIAVPAAGFEHQHARVLGQPVRQRAAGGAGADDDVVVFGCGLHWALQYLLLFFSEKGKYTWRLQLNWRAVPNDTVHAQYDRRGTAIHRAIAQDHCMKIVIPDDYQDMVDQLPCFALIRHHDVTRYREPAKAPR